MCHMYVCVHYAWKKDLHVGNPWFYMFKPWSWFVCEISFVSPVPFHGLFVMKVVVGTQIQTWELSCEDAFVMWNEVQFLLDKHFLVQEVWWNTVPGVPGLVFQKRHPKPAGIRLHGSCNSCLDGLNVWKKTWGKLGSLPAMKWFHGWFFL